ncbi:uncharacterized protein A1O9_12768 [Exophiala aquamarina CBS 119918]|uniref:Uncharacterized protein n=1 Tax=Exophiala aquamarina CBS 119918 TaxID=1182545 RepID=A0A072NTE3_9EURO|nr:uncharacterized protein A1O9_12768 [Exophiala aquamarina CBS 119918]KEF51154.1 hypothetical protein A1O9_12768 [Exophiala aquamarina CBS 119918]
MAQATSNPTFITDDVQESFHDLLEYVDLIQLGSPRVQSMDQVDPFISRYSVPDDLSEKELEKQNVRVLRWEGLISAQWMLTLLYALITQSRLCDSASLTKQHQWLLITATTHKRACKGGADGYKVLLQPNPDMATSTQVDEDANHSEGPEAIVPDRVGMSWSSANLEFIAQGESGIPSELPKQSQRLVTGISSGFQRFLCAEYVNGVSCP